MGYKVSSLKTLPIIPGIDLYVFILGNNNWVGGYEQIINDNFSSLAKNLGERGAIIAGHDGIKLANELPALLSEAAHTNETVKNFIEKGESLGLSILLLGAHPNELTDNDLFLLSPVEQIVDNFKSLEQFFSELCNYSENKDPSFLQKFEDQNSIDGGIRKYLHLKPGMFGIGLNVDAIYERLKKS